MRVIFATIFKNARALLPLPQVYDFEKIFLNGNGERVRTAAGWHPESRGVYRDIYGKVDRSWKCHRRSQIGGQRI